eukprot:13229636-Alexandrium_andersonii.AAC.1
MTAPPPAHVQGQHEVDGPAAVAPAKPTRYDQHAPPRHSAKPGARTPIGQPTGYILNSSFTSWMR